MAARIEDGYQNAWSNMIASIRYEPESQMASKS